MFRITGVLLILLVYGCVSGGSQASNVVIGREASESCSKLKSLEVKATSKDAIKAQLKEKCAGAGGNYVHLQEVRLNRKTNEYTAEGVAFICH